MNRRDVLKGMIALCAAPAIVKADSLMKIKPHKEIVTFPKTSGDWGYIHNGGILVPDHIAKDIYIVLFTSNR